MKKIKLKIKDKLGEKRVAILRKVWRVLRIVKNIVCWTLIAVLTLALVVFIVTKNNGETPTVFGYSVHRIMSGSMEPELSVGDVIINKDVTDPSEVRVGDIVTFQGGSDFENNKVTHRVLVNPYDDGRGSIVLVTKGDANNIDDGEINFKDVESKCLKKVNFLRDIYNFFFSKVGLLVFIFLLLLIFFDEIMNIFRYTVLAHNEDGEDEPQPIPEKEKNALPDPDDQNAEDAEKSDAEADEKPAESESKPPKDTKPKSEKNQNGNKKSSQKVDQKTNKKKPAAKSSKGSASKNSKKKPKKKAKKKKKR